MAFEQYTDEELKVVMALDREIANEVFCLARRGFDVREVLHEARLFKAEAEMMKNELRRRRKACAQKKAG